jgi:hypothetical protein
MAIQVILCGIDKRCAVTGIQRPKEKTAAKETKVAISVATNIDAANAAPAS